MKRLLIAFTVLAAALVIVAAVGWERGKTCPPFVGYACFELAHGEGTEQIQRFMDYAIQASGDNHFQQQRWPGAQNAVQAASAYRASLRYSITRGHGNPQLHIWCVASSSITAVDGPVFPGRLAHGARYGMPSLQKLPLVSHATRTTSLQKMLYGLGMYPPGSPLPGDASAKTSKPDPTTAAAPSVL